MIYIGADHGGFQLKERLKEVLSARHLVFRDLGASRYVAGDDYPNVAAKVARAVTRDPDHRGVLVCRSGVGVAIAANKIPGIRAVQGVSVHIARRSRREEDCNVLALAGDYLSFVEARTIMLRWLSEPFRSIERYRRRNRQLDRLDHGGR